MPHIYIYIYLSTCIYTIRYACNVARATCPTSFSCGATPSKILKPTWLLQPMDNSRTCTTACKQAATRIIGNDKYDSDGNNDDGDAGDDEDEDDDDHATRTIPRT